MCLHLKYISSYSNIGKWYKGNLHAHCAENSGCSAIPLKGLIARYIEKKYDFLAITDHDHLTKLPDALQTNKIQILRGFEYSRERHMLIIGVDGLIRLDQQLSITRAKNQNALVILNHPNWEQPKHWNMEQLLALDGYDGIEIYNGLINRLAGKSIATDVWDQLLTKGKWCWGFATDDSHEIFDIGRAWVWVQAARCDAKSIIPALQHGDFYASTGVKLKTIKLIQNKIHIETDEETAFRFIGPEGKVLGTHLGSLAEYWIEGREDYVRVEGWNDKGWFWTQPFFGE
ncbi:MAG: PHP domain-containing protein [Methanosarcinaceae archaeon]